MAERSDTSPFDTDGKLTRTSPLPVQPNCISPSAVRTIASSVSNLAVSENRQPDASPALFVPASATPSSPPDTLCLSTVSSTPHVSDQDSCCCPPKKKKISKELSEVFQQDDVGSSTELRFEDDPSRSLDEGYQQLDFSEVSFQKPVHQMTTVSTESGQPADGEWQAPGGRNESEVSSRTPRPRCKNQASTREDDEPMPLEHCRQSPVDCRSLLREVVLTPSPYWCHESGERNGVSHRQHPQPYCEMGDGVSDAELDPHGGCSGQENSDEFTVSHRVSSEDARNTGTSISQQTTKLTSSGTGHDKDILLFQSYARDNVTFDHRFSTEEAVKTGSNFSQHFAGLVSSSMDCGGDAVEGQSEMEGNVTYNCRSEDRILQTCRACTNISKSPSAVEPGRIGFEEEALQLEPGRIGFEEEALQLEPGRIGCEEEALQLEPGRIGCREEALQLEPGRIGCREEALQLEPGRIGCREEALQLEPGRIGCREEALQLEPGRIGCEEEALQLEPGRIGCEEEALQLEPGRIGCEEEALQLEPGRIGCGEEALQLEPGAVGGDGKKSEAEVAVSTDYSSAHVVDRAEAAAISSFRIDFSKLTPSSSFDVQVCTTASSSASVHPADPDFGYSASVQACSKRDAPSMHRGLPSSHTDISDFGVSMPSCSTDWSAQLPSMHQASSSSHTDTSNSSATVPSDSADWDAHLPSLYQGPLTSSTDYETDTSACSESSSDTTTSSSDSCPGQSAACRVNSARLPPSPKLSSSSPSPSKTRQARKGPRKLKQKTPRYGLKTDAVGALLGMKRSEYARVRQVPTDCRTKGLFTGKERWVDLDQRQKGVAVDKELPTLGALPTELLVHIFSFLPPATRLSAVSLVCKRWQSAVLSPALWRRLDLRNLPRLRDGQLDRLATLSDRVSSLILSDGGSTLLTDKGVALAVSHCPHLKKVKFNRCFFLSDEAFQSAGHHCHKLVCLNLSGCFTVTDKTLVAVSEGCPQLQDLDVGQCAKITDIGVCAVAKGCPRLTRFRLDQCGKLSNVAVETVANCCPDLQYLHLLSCSLTDAGIFHLAKLRRLVVLDVSNVSKLSPRVVDNVTAACPCLETLAISLNRAVDDTCLQAIVRHCPRLRCLSCVACSLSDVGLRHIACHAKHLERLDVAWCSDITDAGVRDLSASCPRLRYLGIMRCGLITMATVEDLLIQYPHIQYSNFELDSRRLLGRAAQEGFGSETA